MLEVDDGGLADAEVHVVGNDELEQGRHELGHRVELAGRSAKIQKGGSVLLSASWAIKRIESKMFPQSMARQEKLSLKVGGDKAARERKATRPTPRSAGPGVD